MKKTIFILTMLIAIMLSLYNVTYASEIDKITQGAENFIDAGKKSDGTVINWEGVKNASDLIYNTLLIAGTVIAVVVASYLGIKFMTSSVEEQAKIKETLIPFIIGCVIIFGAFGIWKLTTNILDNEQGGSGGGAPIIQETYVQ